MAYSKVEIAKILSGIDNLPTLPMVASELLKMLGNLNVSMSNISKIMNNDPAITAKVLKIANSAYYSLRKKVDTLRMALVVLGINEITNIIVSLSLVKLFSSSNNSLFDHSLFWKHNIYTAHFSKAISKFFKLPFHGEEFTAGLMHDIGKIILDQFFHNDFIQCLTIQNMSPEMDPLDLESEIIGATHQELGLWLAEVWKIPENIRQVIKFHHTPELDDLNNNLSSVICLANIWANYTVTPELLQRDFDNIKDSFAWKHLCKDCFYELEDLSTMIDVEIETSNTFISQMINE